MATFCGMDCQVCDFKANCKGCAAQSGASLDARCVLARCGAQKGVSGCSACDKANCTLRKALRDELNALPIDHFPNVDALYVLKGDCVNLAYPMPSGEAVKLLCDDNAYLVCQLEAGERCFGVAADEHFLAVSTYAAQGADPELVLFKKR